jgi:glutamine amidotransferase
MDQMRERELIELVKPVPSRCWAFASACSCWGGAAKKQRRSAGHYRRRRAENDRPRLPLPHMGWNRVYPKAGNRLFAVSMTARIFISHMPCR